MIEFDIALQRGDFRLEAAATLPLGGVSALVGKSGSGKTTLLRALAGLETCSGHIHFDKQAWQSESGALASHQRPAALVFQDNRLFPHLSVRGNIDYAIQRAVGKPPDRDKLIAEFGLSELTERNISDLSGGQQKRVAMARALAQAPKLLMLDEPLAGLDGEAKRECLRALQRLRNHRDITIIYVSHQLEEIAELADQLIHIDRGRIIEQAEMVSWSQQIDHHFSGEVGTATVLAGTIQNTADACGLVAVSLGGAQLLIPEAQLPAKNAAIGNPLQLSIAARDVSVALSAATDSSIVNIIPATLASIRDEENGSCLLQLAIGEQHLLARITEASRQRLKLQCGQPLFAQIKSVALLRENY